MDIRYPGSTGPFPARAAETKAELPVTIIALCDGTALGFAGQPNLDTVRSQNAEAADRLVERIAKRVVEMQAEQAKAARAVWAGPVTKFEFNGIVSKETTAAIDKSVSEALKAYSERLSQAQAERKVRFE